MAKANPVGFEAQLLDGVLGFTYHYIKIITCADETLW